MVDTVNIAVNSQTGPVASRTIANDARHLAIAVTSTGNAINIPLGNDPLRVVVVNETDTIVWEWRKGMAATKTLKTTGVPTVAIDTGSAIVVSGDAQNGNLAVTISASAAGSAKALTVFIDL